MNHNGTSCMHESNQKHSVTMMFKRQGHGQIIVILATNINLVSVWYMKNKNMVSGSEKYLVL